MQTDILFSNNTEQLRSKVEKELSITVEMCYGAPLYSVKCDSENNTEESIGKNKLVVHFTGNTVETPSFSLTLEPDTEAGGPKFNLERL